MLTGDNSVTCPARMLANYIVTVINGKIDFIEITTNGDDLINEDSKLYLKPIS